MKNFHSPVSLIGHYRQLQVEFLESRVVPSTAPLDLKIGYQPTINVSNCISFLWSDQIYGTLNDGSEFSGAYTVQYGQLSPKNGGPPILWGDIKQAFSKAPLNTEWSVFQNGQKVPVNLKYYSEGGTSDLYLENIPAKDFQLGLKAYYSTAVNSALLPLNLLSNGLHYQVEVREGTTGPARSDYYLGFEGLDYQTGTIALPDLDYSAETNLGRIVSLRAHAGEQVAALVLEANRTYKLQVSEYGKLVGGSTVPVAKPLPDSWEPQDPNFVISAEVNRPGIVVKVYGIIGKGAGWTVEIDTTGLGGKAGIAALKISSNLKLADVVTTPRFIGLVVKDALGNMPTKPDHLAIGTVNSNTEKATEFFRGNLKGDPNYRTVKAFDYQYIYLNGGPLLVPHQAEDDQKKFLPNYTSITAPIDNPPMVNNSSAWRTSGQGYDGKKLIQSLRESIKLGSIPTVVLYNFMAGVTGAPPYTNVNEGSGLALANLKNSTFMTEYFKDFKFAMDIIRKYAQGTTVDLIVEPDFLSYLFKNEKLDPKTAILNYNVGEIAVLSGVLPAGVVLATSAGNTLRDFVLALNGAIRHLSTVGSESVNIRFGWKFNLWAAEAINNKGISKTTDATNEFPTFAEGQKYIKDQGVVVADWFSRAGILSMPVLGATNPRPSDFMALDKYGIDGGRPIGTTAPGYTDPYTTAWYFNADHWNNYLLLAGTIRKTLMEKTPGVTDYGIRMWQIPVGRINNNVPITGEPPFANLPDKMVQVPTDQGSFEDSAVSYFFGQSFTGLTTNPDADNTKRAEFFNPEGFGNRAGDPLVRKDSCGNIVYESHFAAAANWGVEAIDFGAGLPEATNGGGYADNTPTDQYFFSFKAGQYLKAPYILGSTTKSSSKVKSGEEHDPAHLGSSPTPLIQYDSPEKNQTAALFRTLLGREPGTDGLESFADALKSGRSEGDLAKKIFVSPEALSKSIAGFYHEFLNRAPDGAGAKAWLDAALAGLSREEILTRILTSDEFSKPLDNGAFVKALFEELLGRSIQTDDLAGYVDALNNGQARRTVVLSILQSQEATETQVQAVYGNILKREPSLLEIQAWRSQLVKPQFDIDDLFLSVLTSTEGLEHTATGMTGSGRSGPVTSAKETNILDWMGAIPVFTKVDISEVVAGADLSYRDLSGMELKDLDLTGVNLKYANLGGANLCGVLLKGANLDGAISGGVRGTPVSLPDGWLLNKGYLIGPNANLILADLSELYLNGQDLSSAQLGKSKLVGTRLTGANLNGANLNGANLTEADLTDADLSGAILIGVISSGITGVPKALPVGWILVDGVLQLGLD